MPGRFTAAAEAIERTVHLFSGVRSLAARELLPYGRDFAAGWEIPGLIESNDAKLRVLVPETAPYSPPRIAVAPAPLPLTWPHLEEAGLLCLLPEGATHELENPGQLTLDLLSDGVAVAQAGISGCNSADFEDEFLSYWARWPKRTAVMFSACRPSGPSRWVSAWHSTAGVFLGETDKSLRAWLQHRFPDKSGNDHDLQRVPLLWLPTVPHPESYPASVATLFAMVPKSDIAFLQEHLFDRVAPHKSLILGCSTRRGAAFFGVRVSKPHRTRRGGRDLSDGFRPQSIPNGTLLTRYLGTPLIGADVRRVDADWVHGRDANTDLRQLLDISTIVFGVGAVGSAVAILLAKAGLGRIVLVDPQTLASENASRHELGIERVGANKAEGLAQTLSQRFPHLEIRGFGVSAAQFCKQNAGDAQKSDLVVSATADWATDTWLDMWAKQNRAGRATMFGWMEPYAAAGHAIVKWGDAPCLRCLLNTSGKLKLPATYWPVKTTRDIPACGGQFQPFGAVELAHVNAVIADLALDVVQRRVVDPRHRVWLGRTDHLKRSGGSWNPEWVAMHGDPFGGGAIHDLVFQTSPQCKECNPT